MKPPDEVQRDLVCLWIAKADQDLAAAEILLDNDVRLTPIMAFHAQQAAEKYSVTGHGAVRAPAKQRRNPL